MNPEQRTTISKHLERMTEERTFVEVLKEIYSISKISRGRLISLLIFSIIMLKIYINVGFSEDTISRVIDVINSSNNFSIPAFAVVFTGYAIFQALSNSATLATLLSVSRNEKSKFEEFNLSYLATALLFLTLVVVNFILLLIFKNIPNDWQIPLVPNLINNILATVLFCFYITVNISALFELKCFIYNLYKCFAINAVANGIEVLKRDDEES
jgi:hypothetical protein